VARAPELGTILAQSVEEENGVHPKILWEDREIEANIEVNSILVADWHAYDSLIFVLEWVSNLECVGSRPGYALRMQVVIRNVYL
jgi:hypothetical protein